MEASRDRTYEVPLHNRISAPNRPADFQDAISVCGKCGDHRKQNIPGDEACIIAINHISIFEPPWSCLSGQSS
jgi:hypothetical protein